MVFVLETIQQARWCRIIVHTGVSTKRSKVCWIYFIQWKTPSLPCRYSFLACDSDCTNAKPNITSTWTIFAI